MPMKIGIDFHGVISDNVEFFTHLTNSMITCGHEVYIVSGSPSEYIKDFCNKHELKFTEIYSITDDLYKKGYEYTLDGKGRKVFDSFHWDRAKAIYCKNNNIDVMIDDSDVYGQYFETEYVRWVL